MKITKLTNLSLEPLDLVLYRIYGGLEVRTGNKFTLAGGGTLDLYGSINYTVDNTRMQDLRIDTYE